MQHHKPYTSDQEVFDLIAVHLLTQDEKSADGLYCLYRRDDGRKCAIGAVIPDDLYKPEIEHEKFYDAVLEHETLRDLFINVDKTMLQELQGVHDLEQPHSWNEKLRNVACDYGLSTAAIDNWEKENAATKQD